uniref:Uncharacterized protein n=1 Tax=Otus sunia TaxID=257818 RepID=A0A8C8AEL0_9STRI
MTRPDLYPPAAVSAAGRVVLPQINLEEVDSSPGLLKGHFKVSSTCTRLQPQEIIRMGKNKIHRVCLKKQ